MKLKFERVTLRNVDRKKPAVINSISFSQPSGVSIGILGQRGSGKSVLMELAIGSLQPDVGRVLRQGRVSMPIGKPATLHPKFTGEEITKLTAGLFAVDEDKLCRFVTEVSEIGDAFRKPLQLYNASLRSRFVFTLSYGIPADFYLADGALFGGDEPFRSRCIELAKQRKSEAAFLFTTRSPRDIRLFADVGGVLKNGRLTFYPDVESAIAAYEA